MKTQSVGEVVRSVEEVAYKARETIRAKVQVVEAEAAELAKGGNYAAAIAKYEEGEKGREEYEKLVNDRGFVARLRMQFPQLCMMPAEWEELGLAPDFALPTHVAARGYDPAPLPVVDVRTALFLLSSHPTPGLYRTGNDQCHTLLADGCDYGTSIAAIPRWIVSVLQQKDVGVVDEWTRVIGKSGRVVANVKPKRACELLMDDMTGLDVRCADEFAALRAVYDKRVVEETTKKTKRNKRARDRRAAKNAALSPTS
jgi:hypothetical protein